MGKRARLLRPSGEETAAQKLRSAPDSEESRDARTALPQNCSSRRYVFLWALYIARSCQPMASDGDRPNPIRGLRSPNVFTALCTVIRHPDYARNHPLGIRVDRGHPCSLDFLVGDSMQDVGQVLRRKRSQQAQLAKEIELLQLVEEKLREVAPLLADSEDENPVLTEVDEEIGQSASPAAKSMAASAGSQSSAAPSESGQATRPLALRWP